MANQDGPQEQTRLHVTLWVYDKAQQVEVPLVWNSEGGGIPITVPAQIITDLDTIAAQTTTIATQITGIHTDTTSIASSTASVATNTGNIATSTATVATNTGTIATNTGTIGTNTGTIATQTTTIATNTGNIRTDTSSIATSSATMATQQTTIATNTGTSATQLTNIDAKLPALDAKSRFKTSDIPTMVYGGIKQLGVTGGTDTTIYVSTASVRLKMQVSNMDTITRSFQVGTAATFADATGIIKGYNLAAGQSRVFLMEEVPNGTTIYAACSQASKVNITFWTGVI